MLAAFRQFAKSPFAIGLVLLLIVGFAAVSFRDVFNGPTGTYVVKVGDRIIAPYEFRALFDRYKGQLEQQYRQQIDLDTAVQEGLDGRVLNEVADQHAFGVLLQRVGLRAPKKVFDDLLRQNPAFFNPVSGEFDRQQFLTVLRDNNATEEMFQRDTKDSIREQQFARAAGVGFTAPKAYTALTASIALEQRDLAFFVVDPRTVAKPAVPTEAELRAFMKENESRLMRPEYRAFQLVRFSRKELAKTVTVDPAEIQKRFDFEKESLTKPELRSVVQINVKDAAQAKAVVARLKAGEAPAVVAGSIGVKPIRFDDKPPTAFFDPKIRAAAYALPLNGVSEPVQGEFGLAVLKVEKIVPGEEAKLEDHRDDIRQRIANELADKKASEAAKVYEDARTAGDDFAVAASKAGLTVVSVPAVSAQGAGEDGRPVEGLTQPVVQAAFSTNQGSQSDILPDGTEGGEYFIVQVDRITAPAMPAFDKIRPMLTQVMVAQRIEAEVAAKAAAFVARLKKGESIDAVAASAGGKVIRINGMTRLAQRQYANLGRELLGGALGSAKNEPFTARGGGGAMAVAVITDIRSGDTKDIGQAIGQIEDQTTQDLYRDLSVALRDYARETVKVKKDQRLARVAIGVPADRAGEGLGKSGAAGADAAKK